MSLESTAQAAIVLTIGGEEVKFIRLDMYDLAELAAKERSKTQAALRRALAASAALAPLDAYKEQRSLECFEVELGDILKLTYQPAYAVEIVESSLMKNGKSKEEAKAIIKLLSPLNPISRKEGEVWLPGVGPLAREIIGLPDKLPPLDKESSADPKGFKPVA